MSQLDISLAQQLEKLGCSKINNEDLGIAETGLCRSTLRALKEFYTQLMQPTPKTQSFWRVFRLAHDAVNTSGAVLPRSLPVRVSIIILDQLDRCGEENESNFPREVTDNTALLVLNLIEWYDNIVPL
jgi:hypothetical protein